MTTYQTLLEETRALFARTIADYRANTHLGQPRFLPWGILQDQARQVTKTVANRADARIADLVRDRPDLLDFTNGISRLTPRDGILTALEIALGGDLAEDIRAEHVRNQDETTLPEVTREAADALRAQGDVANAEKLEAMVERSEFDLRFLHGIATRFLGEPLHIDLSGAVSARSSVMDDFSPAAAPQP